MKKLFSLFAFAAMTIVLSGCEKESETPVDVLTKIPDATFLAYCQESMADWDTDADGKLSVEEAAVVTNIRLYDTAAASLAGVEYFTGLTTLECAVNQLTSLDVSGCAKLNRLSCGNNLLVSLDISGNTALADLFCDGNPGDGVSKFPITAWFDNGSVPAGLSVFESSWQVNNDPTITVDFQKAD